MAWLDFLGNLPPWRHQARRVVVVSPHPDDEILGAGGFLSDIEPDRDVIVIAVTDGEAAYLDCANLAQIRQREQEEAMAAIHLDRTSIRRLRVPDGDVAQHEEQIAAQLTEMLDGSTLLLAPWEKDYHPDHEACGRAAALAARRAGATLVSYFFWTWHHADPSAMSHLSLRSFHLTPEAFERKQRALSKYESQLMREHGEPILPEPLLTPARRPFEVFAIHDAQY